MNRRDFLRSAATASVGLALVNSRPFFARELPNHWRTFDITTRLEVLNPSGRTRVWVPAVMPGHSPFQRTLWNRIDAVGGSATTRSSKPDAMEIISAEFPSGVKPVLTVTSRVATRNFDVDLDAKPRVARRADAAELRYFLRPTKLLPTDGIVKETASQITRGATSDVEKARLIYEWIVENTFRNPETRGCGIGDIRFMLESHDFGGKCADLNGLFVGLARSVGLPARDVYGVRVAKSSRGYKSLGTATENSTKAQHCRAEVYLEEYGWVPVDPADVRKVALEEPPGHRPLDDQLVKQARAQLFGSWEMNWVAYNFGHDVVLPGSDGAPLGYFMYPQAETAGGRLDCLDPDNFKYEITSKEIAQANAV